MFSSAEAAAFHEVEYNTGLPGARLTANEDSPVGWQLGGELLTNLPAMQMVQSDQPRLKMDIFPWPTTHQLPLYKPY